MTIKERKPSTDLKSIINTIFVFTEPETSDITQVFL